MTSTGSAGTFSAGGRTRRISGSEQVTLPLWSNTSAGLPPRVISADMEPALAKATRLLKAEGSALPQWNT